MQVNRIKMKPGRLCSYNPLDIQGVYIDNTYHDVAEVYDYLSDTDCKILVSDEMDIYLIKALSLNGCKYLRTNQNKGFVDSLLNLPRE